MADVIRGGDVVMPQENGSTAVRVACRGRIVGYRVVAVEVVPGEPWARVMLACDLGSEFRIPWEQVHWLQPGDYLVAFFADESRSVVVPMSRSTFWTHFRGADTDG